MRPGVLAALVCCLCVGGCDDGSMNQMREIGQPSADADMAATDADLSGDALPPLPDARPLESDVRFNQIQVRGSENSYHLSPGEDAPVALQYSQPPFAVQLGEQGLREFDFDTAYNSRSIAIEVYTHHLGDEETLCYFLGFCLSDMSAWSDAHPDHAPIVVLIEANIAHDLHDGLQVLQHDIRTGIGRDRLFIPADLQGEHDNVRDAIRADGWPPVADLRGRFIFVLHDRERARENYLAGVTLRADPERLLFVLADSPEDPYAAFFSFDTIDDEAAVAALIADGFVVRTIVDDPINRARAIALGVHFLSSRYPDDNLPPEAISGAPVACNPVTAPADCVPEMIER